MLELWYRKLTRNFDQMYKKFFRSFSCLTYEFFIKWIGYLCFLWARRFGNQWSWICRWMRQFQFWIGYSINWKQSTLLPIGHSNNPTNTPRVYLNKTRRKPSFPRLFNVEYAWCDCREICGTSNIDDYPINLLTSFLSVVLGLKGGGTEAVVKRYSVNRYS